MHLSYSMPSYLAICWKNPLSIDASYSVGSRPALPEREHALPPTDFGPALEAVLLGDETGQTGGADAVETPGTQAGLCVCNMHLEQLLKNGLSQ